MWSIEYSSHKFQRGPKTDSESSRDHSIRSLNFEPHSVEGRLQEMNLAPVASDHELAARPVRVLMSADQEFQGELFEDVIVGGLEIAIGKWTEDGTRFGDVLDEEFVGEIGE
jgi:hypothetical protein